MKKSIFILLALIILPLQVHAQQLESSLTPRDYSIAVEPGRTIPLSYTLTNTGDPTVFELKTYLVSPDSSTKGYQLLPYPNDPESALPYVTAGSAKLPIDSPFLLASQEAIEFELQLHIPEGTQSRDYYLAIVAESEPAQGFEDVNRIVLKGGLGSLLYITVTDTPYFTSEGRIALFDNPSSFTLHAGERSIRIIDSSKSEVPITLQVAAVGDYGIDASGKIIVTPQWGEAYEILLPTQKILAGSERLLLAESALQDDATMILTPSFINTYRIESYVQFGDHSNASQEIYVVTFPLQQTAFWVGGIFLAVFFFLLHKYIKK